jgi:hypothetical protein
MQLKTDIYRHCQEIASAASVPGLVPEKYADIMTIVEVSSTAEVAARAVCKAVGMIATPQRMKDVEAAING